ncbi:VOC family protein [uncultured Sphingomonas sp.]|uniref:VOC family protein n=1 Tax=uncultured Sphingomonas sp. TaxID=158754 RepID=UPI0025FE1404|nr:VOC family protein [uncultured Sphingomonas sp.]
MRSAGFWMLPGLLAGLFAPLAAQAKAAGHVSGVGGVFVTSKDPKALVAWYRDVLGIAVEPWGGAMLRYDAPGHPPVLVWTAMRPGSDQIAPSPRAFMLNFAVDDLDAMLTRLEAKGVKILKRTSDATGKFAWILDPDGTKIELWQPPVK